MSEPITHTQCGFQPISRGWSLPLDTSRRVAPLCPSPSRGSGRARRSPSPPRSWSTGGPPPSLCAPASPAPWAGRPSHRPARLHHMPSAHSHHSPPGSDGWRTLSSVPRPSALARGAGANPNTAPAGRSCRAPLHLEHPAEGSRRWLKLQAARQASARYSSRHDKRLLAGSRDRESYSAREACLSWTRVRTLRPPGSHSSRSALRGVLKGQGPCSWSAAAMSCHCPRPVQAVTPLSLSFQALTLMQLGPSKKAITWPASSGAMPEMLVYAHVVPIAPAGFAASAGVPQPAAEMPSLLQSCGHVRLPHQVAGLR